MMQTKGSLGEQRQRWCHW